jgi:hypothetical protein
MSRWTWSRDVNAPDPEEMKAPDLQEMDAPAPLSKRAQGIVQVMVDKGMNRDEAETVVRTFLEAEADAPKQDHMDCVPDCEHQCRVAKRMLACALSCGVTGYEHEKWNCLEFHTCKFCGPCPCSQQCCCCHCVANPCAYLGCAPVGWAYWAMKAHDFLNVRDQENPHRDFPRWWALAERRWKV